MDSGNQSVWVQFKGFVEHLLALRVTEAERLRYADDLHNIFGDDISGRKPLQVASVLALLFHILLLIIVFPSWGASILVPERDVFVIQQLARPAMLAGAEGREAAKPPEPKPVTPPPKPKVVPIPDPTPNAPEPIRRKEIEETPRVLQEVALDLNIGDVTAPPGPPSTGGVGDSTLGGTGVSTEAGPGPGTGLDGVHKVGGGVTNPVVLIKTTPAYTDEGIKAKVQGVVLLQAVIRKDGKADSFKVVRGLGYGLEESAIQEIAQNWKFKPGMKNGQNVDVLAFIEVTFHLR